MKNDHLLTLLAAYTRNADLVLDEPMAQAARAAVMDSFAVALGALSHPAAVAARRYARHFPVAHGATIWGSGLRVSVETAALVNGVPLRAYDYNDLYIGKGGGHPSDMVPGLIALAQWRRLDGKSLLAATALGYEIASHLYDNIKPEATGFDYPNIIAIAATCAGARLLDLSETQTREAIAITIIPHFASNEVESNELNARGDLTMWKRLNGSDAVRHSMYACLLAESGVEGAVRPFEGRHGLLAKMAVASEDVHQIYAVLGESPKLNRITQTTYKRWPVGSRGQSAIQAALEARAGIPDISRIQHIRVTTDEAVYDHLVRQREDPWNPISRETADHSLPCIVATAILDGEIRTSTFEAAKVLDPARRTLLNDRLTVEPSAELAGGITTGFLTRVEIVDDSGHVSVGEARAAPGHPLNPFSKHDFEVKFKENVTPLFGLERTDDLIRVIWNLDSNDDVQRLCDLCLLENMAGASAGDDVQAAPTGWTAGL